MSWACWPIRWKPFAAGQQAAARIAEIVRERDVAQVVVGIPRQMSGEIGPAATEALQFVEKLRQLLPCEVATWDERLTTVAANRALREAGKKTRDTRGYVDQVAAQMILQGHLDRRQEAADGEGNFALRPDAATPQIDYRIRRRALCGLAKPEPSQHRSGSSRARPAAGKRRKCSGPRSGPDRYRGSRACSMCACRCCQRSVLSRPLDRERSMLCCRQQFACFVAATFPLNFTRVFRAKGKVYRYRIWSGQVLPPLEYERAWHVIAPLNFELLKEAARAICRHSRLCSDSPLIAANPPNPMADSKARHGANNSFGTGSQKWIARNDRDFDGDGFLYKMVRLMVGGLVECAMGKSTVKQIGTGSIPAVAVRPALRRPLKVYFWCVFGTKIATGLGHRGSGEPVRIGRRPAF